MQLCALYTPCTVYTVYFRVVKDGNWITEGQFNYLAAFVNYFTLLSAVKIITFTNERILLDR